MRTNATAQPVNQNRKRMISKLHRGEGGKIGYFTYDCVHC